MHLLRDQEIKGEKSRDASLSQLPKLQVLFFKSKTVVPISPFTAFLDSFKPRPIELYLEHFLRGSRGEPYGGDYAGEYRRDEDGKVIPLEE